MNSSVTDDTRRHKVQPGDRIEIELDSFSDRTTFGKVIDYEPSKGATGHGRAFVRLRDGTYCWLSANKICYIPLRRSIRQQAKSIRKSWSPAELRSRAGMGYLRPSETSEPVTIPIVRDEWSLSLLLFGRVD